MKTHSLLISFLMLLVIMGACSSGPVMRNATGFAYEIVVTMDKADWDAPAGKAIKAELPPIFQDCHRLNLPLRSPM